MTDHVHDFNSGPGSDQCVCGVYFDQFDKLKLGSAALEEAAAHLAGLGRGKFHRVDVESDPATKGSIKLDGVELRGVSGFVLQGKVGDLTRITLTMIVSVGRDNDP